MVLYVQIAVLLLVLLALYALKPFVVIGGQEIGVVERRYFGAKLPAGRVIALPGQIGIQARTLGPGLHFLIPLVFKVTKTEFVSIGEDEIGIVESIDGDSVPPGRIFARSAPNHDSFQDAEAFLRNGGQKGPQTDIIPPGTYRLNTHVFQISIREATNIPQGFIGVVTSADGSPMDAGRLLAQTTTGHGNFQNGDGFLANRGQKGPQAEILLPGLYRINTRLFGVDLLKATAVPAGQIGLVTAKDGSPLPEKELVAKVVDGHDNYQNASKFLASGGQRGPQLEVLPPGTYYVNPLMFTVETADATTVDQGQVAVTISNVGKEPDSSLAVGAIADSPDNIERYVVPKGYRGIQREVLGPGVYYINTRAYREVILSTINQTIDWEEANEKAFNPLQVVSKDGFKIQVGVKVVVRVLPQQAPYMVARIGSMENLKSNVIHPLIDSSFRNQASSTEAMKFLQDRHEQQEEALKRTKGELDKYHVEVLSVLISQITLPEDLMATQTNKVLANQRQDMYAQQQAAEQKRIAMERTKAEADQQAALMTAEIGVKVAQQEKMKTITTAEGAQQRMVLEGQGEASKILQIGEATANAYTLTAQAIGAQGLTSIELAKLIASGGIKITPEILVSGGGTGSGSLVDVLVAQLVAKNTVGSAETSATVG